VPPLSLVLRRTIEADEQPGGQEEGVGLIEPTCETQGTFPLSTPRSKTAWK